MVSMVDEFATSLVAKQLAVVSSNDSQQIKLVEEHWQQKSKRGHGRYTKAPDDNTLSRMKSNLLVPILTKINEGLSFPILVPEWLDVAIGILLSIESVRNRVCSSSASTRHAPIPILTNSVPILNLELIGIVRIGIGIGMD